MTAEPVRRSTLRITPDCDHCPARRTCVVLSQIEDNFAFAVFDAPKGIHLSLRCSEYERLKKVSLRLSAARLTEPGTGVGKQR